jgi:hypothetical protein
MKKILVSLLVLAMVAPAMAVVLDTVDNADGTMTITMDTEGAAVRGVALTVTCTNGASLVDLSYDVNPEFNTFIDFLALGTTTFAGDTPDPGTDSPAPHPYAAAGSTAGEATADPTTGDTEFVVSMGMLDETKGQAGYTGSGNLITINTGAGDVCVSLDTVRGGVVGDAELTVTFQDGGDSDCVTVTDEPDECMKNTHPDYTMWVDYNRPDCWCYAAQCKGDLDGKDQLSGAVNVYTNDLDIFLPAFGSLQTTEPGVCADIDHKKQLSGAVNVYTNDLDIFLPNFGSKQTACDDTHINFWITPE